MKFLDFLCLSAGGMSIGIAFHGDPVRVILVALGVSLVSAGMALSMKGVSRD